MNSIVVRSLYHEIKISDFWDIGPSNLEIFRLSLFSAFLVNSRLGRPKKHGESYLRS